MANLEKFIFFQQLKKLWKFWGLPCCLSFGMIIVLAISVLSTLSTSYFFGYHRDIYDKESVLVELSAWNREGESFLNYGQGGGEGYRYGLSCAVIIFSVLFISLKFITKPLEKK